MANSFLFTVPLWYLFTDAQNVIDTVLSDIGREGSSRQNNALLSEVCTELKKVEKSKSRVATSTFDSDSKSSRKSTYKSTFSTFFDS